MSALDAVAARLGALGRRDAPLGARTTYRVGGTAAVLATVRTAADLRLVADALDGTDVEVLVVGRGSNLLVADAGFDGVAVVLEGEFDRVDDARVEPDGTATVRAGGAVALPVLARRLTELGLVGLEWAVGVPGSVGGAVRMNAGGHGDDTAHALVQAELVDLRTGGAVTRGPDALELAYRRSNVRADEVVTAATFSLRRGDRATSRRTLSEIVRWRREHQPGGANCGSVFQNPEGDHAARLVEHAGGKGHRHGTAAVSTKHANFIQADNGGRADDVFALITEVRDLVAQDSGVVLSTEVVFVGFEVGR